MLSVDWIIDLTGMAHWRLVLTLRKFCIVAVGLMFSYNPLFQAWYVLLRMRQLLPTSSILIGWRWGYAVVLVRFLQRVYGHLVHGVRHSHEVYPLHEAANAV